MKKDLICFLHIEKAAGTTFHHILSNNFNNYLTISPAYYWSNENENYLTSLELKWLLKLTLATDAIGGHPLRAEPKYELTLKRPVKFIIFLRDPVSRYISHFKHQKFAKGIDWSIQSFITEDRFNDYMTRRLSPSNNLDEAKATLDRIAFIGLMDQFDESLILLKKQIQSVKFKPFYEKQNIGESIELDFLDNPEILKCIVNNNKNDIALYKYAQSLFKENIKKYGNNFEIELNLFRRQNIGYSFSRIRSIRSRLYRLLYYKPLQYIIKILLHKP